MMTTNEDDRVANAAAYLQTLPAVRERARKVYERALAGKLAHFDLDLARLDAVASFVRTLIERDYPSTGPDGVPPHSRWRHFEAGGVDRIAQLLAQWERAGAADNDATERTRRVVDLFVVSVLLDAGAGSAWRYTERATGKTYARSEGLAIASLDMFCSGLFSCEPARQPTKVDANRLSKLTVEELAAGFQADEQTNPLICLENRVQLLNRLGAALVNGSEWFGQDPSATRPGNLVDYLLRHPTTDRTSGIVIQLQALWPATISGFGPVWPATRTCLGGICLGDVWPLSGEIVGGEPRADDLVPFHKLSQWLTYSLVDALTRTLGGVVRVAGTEDLTGLPEYRNGGLLVDMDVLRLREADRERGLACARRELVRGGDKCELPPTEELVPLFDVFDPVVVEWRALTVAMLDEVADRIRVLLGKPDLELAKVLEGGTWKAGREIACKLRPISRGPPIGIISDGTVF